MKNDFLEKIRRGLRKPPKVIAERILRELCAEAERFASPIREKRLDDLRLLRELGFKDLASCWRTLAEKPFASSLIYDLEQYEMVCPTDRERILLRAEMALAHEVDLLGSGAVNLGKKINWHKDYMSGFDWPPAYFRSIEYSNLDRSSDVKFPWEVSRLQWLIPAGQAYLLTNDERYAFGVREVLEQWMMANSYAHSVNWACTMEVALRILTWSWFFHVFHDSDSWSDENFRARFLRTMYLHGDFTARHLEKSDINGNHYTANAAGLVFAGLFFGTRGRGERWHSLGWKILNDEFPKQVFTDGVDFEASIPYHRLVLELFLFPAVYRMRQGYSIPVEYQDRLLAMARFTAAYSRYDGSVPLWGDADDARALPFGGQQINDHRYLLGLVGCAFDDKDLQRYFSGDLAEIYWWLGKSAVDQLSQTATPLEQPSSQAFPEGGFYIMRNESDHIFIDCGPLGLAGRGGHGHNDALSFEATLCGVHLITDSGSFQYTADYRARNRFRSTISHNTPTVDGEEINRFIRPDYLWNLHDDAKPELVEWSQDSGYDRFVGKHYGYIRFNEPVIPVRTIELCHFEHRLVVQDQFIGEGEHEFEVPLHLAADVEIEKNGTDSFLIRKEGKTFVLQWESTGKWEVNVEVCKFSPSYGRLVNIWKIVWRFHGNTTEANLKLVIEPKQKD